MAETHAPARGRTRRLASIAAALMIAVVAVLLWTGRATADATPGDHAISHVMQGNSVAPNVTSNLRTSLDTAERGTTNPAPRAQVSRTGLCAWHLEFCKYRGLYRQVAVPFLILSAIALPCWAVLRLHRRRTRRRPLSYRRELLLLTLVVYLLCLATLTLTPNSSTRLRAGAIAGIDLRPNLATLTCAPALLPRVSNAQSFCTQNAVGNVMLFFPLGVLIPLIWGQVRFWRGMQVALALSIGIELIQYLSRWLGSYRSVDINDVILNGLGACLGLAVVLLLRWRPGSRPAVRDAATR